MLTWDLCPFRYEHHPRYLTFRRDLACVVHGIQHSEHFLCSPFHHCSDRRPWYTVYTNRLVGVHLPNRHPSGPPLRSCSLHLLPLLLNWLQFLNRPCLLSVGLVRKSSSTVARALSMCRQSIIDMMALYGLLHGSRSSVTQNCSISSYFLLSSSPASSY